jgi:hypothetical protein
LADLRKVLAIEAWNVTGLHMAATWRGRSCANTRKASAASSSILCCRRTYTVAANWQNARDGFDNLFQACAAEPACNAAHHHLEETFTGLVNKLEAEPLTATVKDWLRNQNYGVPMLQGPSPPPGMALGISPAKGRFD